MNGRTARTRGTLRLARIVIAGSLALTACGASGTTAPPSATAVPPTATPTATSLATVAPTASPGAAKERTLVYGTTDCSAVKETPIEGVERPVRITFDCTYRMSDPRVSGPQPMDCDESFFDLPDLPGGVGLWATCSGILQGQGGTWQTVDAYGSEFMQSGTLRTSGTHIYRGEGAFAGLRFVMHFSSSPELTALYTEEYQVAGWIEPITFK
jgi:hypothetical protein